MSVEIKLIPLLDSVNFFPYDKGNRERKRTTGEEREKCIKRKGYVSKGDCIYQIQNVINPYSKWRLDIKISFYYTSIDFYYYIRII